MNCKNRRKPLILIAVASAVILAALAVPAVLKADPGQTPGETACAVTEAITEPVTEPPAETTLPSATADTEPATEPPVVKETRATIGAVGDILMHKAVIDSGCGADGTYDFYEIFDDFNEAVNGVDFAVANLEVTLCGDDNGFEYQGYPNFNCPDAIVDALKNAGFDMLLTANNHAYDTGAAGFVRTQQVVEKAGLLHIGSRPSGEDRPYYIADINGIRVGRINYT